MWSGQRRRHSSVGVWLTTLPAVHPMSRPKVQHPPQSEHPLVYDRCCARGMYTTALEVLRMTGVVQASQLTGIPISTIRDVVGSVEETGTVAPKKSGRKEGTGTLFTVESMERFQDFIDEHPESTLKEMKDFFEERFGVSPDISTISKLLGI